MIIDNKNNIKIKKITIKIETLAQVEIIKISINKESLNLNLFKKYKTSQLIQRTILQIILLIIINKFKINNKIIIKILNMYKKMELLKNKNKKLMLHLLK